jgi:hypothetical protein
MAEEEKPSEAPAEKPQVDLHYIKSSHFRVIHVDGAVGGISPDGEGMRVGLFSERIPIPIQVTHEMDEKGQLGEELKRVGRNGVVREVEVELAMDILAAKRLVVFLARQIKEREKHADAIDAIRQAVREKVETASKEGAQDGDR